MRLLVCIACACAAFAPVAARAAYDLSFTPRPDHFAFSRTLDPGGGGSTYVLDELQATLPASPVAVGADTYTFHFDFAAMPVQISPSVERIDFMAALGAIESPFGVGSSAGQNLATLSFDVDNLRPTGKTGRTVTYFAAGSSVDAVGVGVDESLRLTAADPVAPGEPFILRSLDVSFRSPPSTSRRTPRAPRRTRSRSGSAPAATSRRRTWGRSGRWSASCPSRPNARWRWWPCRCSSGGGKASPGMPDAASAPPPPPAPLLFRTSLDTMRSWQPETNSGTSWGGGRFSRSA
jgi:hypothetical protein